MSSWATMLATLIFAGPPLFGDYIPDGITNVCLIEASDVVVAFLGDGASDKCDWAVDPGGIGPSGWSYSTQSVDDQDVPVCAFRAFGVGGAGEPRVLMRVYAPSPAPVTALRLCTGRTQFFPNADDI
jgi:hypothetical protein